MGATNANQRFVRILWQSVVDPAADATLLARFVETRDEAAFAAIVERHGPLVLGTCRRMLGNSADADDAFQAVFLALVRNGRVVRKRASLAAWLYGAAYRVCLRARRGRARSKTINRTVDRPTSSDPLANLTVREFLSILDDELARLPDRFRLPLVLCLIEGLSQNEAATRLHCSPGSIKGRLERGREKLRKRLSARGITLAAALSAAVGSASAAIPPALFERTTSVAAGKAVPEAIARLAGAATRSGVGLVRVTAVALVGAAISIAAALGGSQESTPKPAAEQPPKPAPPAARLDRFGDLLPDGALMRLGTVQFRVPHLVGVGFRPSGELVALTEHMELYVWPADTKLKPTVTSLAGKKPMYGWQAISPNAHFVAATMGIGRLIVWDVSGKEPVEYLTRELNQVEKLWFSADSAWLVIKRDTNQPQPSLLLCNLADKTFGELPFQGQYVQSLSFTPDGKSIALLTHQAATIIDTATRKERFRADVSRTNVNHAELSPDGKVLAIQPVTFIHGPDPKAQFLSVSSGQEIAKLQPPSGKLHFWIAFSPDGKTILQGGPHGIREWDPVAGKVVREIAGPAESPPVYSADRRRLACHNNNAILLWDVTNGRPVRPDLEDAGHTQTVFGIVVSPEGKLIATNASYGEIRVWSANTGRLLYRVRTSLSGERSVAFLPDSKSFIALADDYVTPVIYEATNGKELRRFGVLPEMAKTETTHELRLSDDGKTLTTSSEPIRVGYKSYAVRWDVSTGKIVERVEQIGAGSMRDMEPAALSPDGRWLVNYGKVTRVGGKESNQLIPAMESGMLNSPRFTADSRLVAITRMPLVGQKIDWNQSSAFIFELASMQKIAEFPAGRTAGYGAAFLPGGRQLAVSGPEHITLWDLATSKPVLRFAPPARTQTIAFTPDGSRMITGHYDCTALVWDLTGTRRTSASELSSRDLSKLWDSLAGDDAAKAFAAGFELSDRPDQAIRVLGERMKPAKAADEGNVRRLVLSLGAQGFNDREAASKELRALGESAIPHLRAAFKTELSPEQKARVQSLLTEASAWVLPPGERLRQARAIAVLERIGNDDARQLLKELAGGMADARQTREAAEALGRLEAARPAKQR
jgi:RNA polymerase sigma factor (sigma-70 family)